MVEVNKRGLQIKMELHLYQLQDIENISKRNELLKALKTLK